MSLLSLDFASAQRPLARPRPYLGLVLLLAGVLLLAFVAWQHEQQIQTNAALSAQRDLLAARLQRRQPQEHLPAESSAQLEQAAAAYAQIATPWEDLFQTLESARSGEIALLSLTADASKREFALGGEAKDFDALNKFSDALSAGPAFGRVALSNHRLSEGAPPIVVRFELTLAWRQEGLPRR